MKKLFLTSFTFTTGGTEYKEQRLVVAPDLETAYDKAMKWFPINFPESQLLSCITHPAIDEVLTEEERTERNAEVVSSFMEHCKKQGVDIPDSAFESYFNA